MLLHHGMQQCLLGRIPSKRIKLNNMCKQVDIGGNKTNHSLRATSWCDTNVWQWSSWEINTGENRTLITGSFTNVWENQYSTTSGNFSCSFHSPFNTLPSGFRK
jgi:hypothetical protein